MEKETKSVEALIAKYKKENEELRKKLTLKKYMEENRLLKEELTGKFTAETPSRNEDDLCEYILNTLFRR